MQNESTNQPHLLNQATVDFDKFYISETRKLQKRLWERFKKFLPDQSGINRPPISDSVVPRHPLCRYGFHRCGQFTTKTHKAITHEDR